MALAIRKDGTLLRDGRPWSGIGVNYVDCFWRILDRSDNDSFREGFAHLAKNGVPFVRFAAGGYWPADWRVHRTDPVDHWRRLDRVVNAAERNGIGLVPSLFWHHATLPDLAGEPVSAWGRNDSRTRRAAAEYTRDLVTRYRRSPAIWAWEFGNEHNLPADLPNAADHRPQIAVDRGTPAKRGPLDDIAHDTFRTALRAFGDLVRQLDPERPISSGHAFPRPTAWHQRREGSWAPDTEGQFSEMLAADNPDPVNTLGGHLYRDENRRFGRPFDADDLLRNAMATARATRKPLFVGEFGAPKSEGDAAFERLLAAIERNRVPLAALWVYDFTPQEADMNVSPRNDRAHLLQRIAESNRRRTGPSIPSRG